MGQAMTGASALALTGVSLDFGGLSVLKNVSLELGAGEVLGLIGPNGAGKSALLNCITGVYRPTQESEISLCGRRIDGAAAHRRAAMGVARTFQHVHLMPQMTVLENVMLGLSSTTSSSLLRYIALPHRAVATERGLAKRAMAALERCGVAEHRDTLAESLPLGVRRLVDLARALVSQPRLLLLDEPASGLTREDRSLIPKLIGIAQEEGDVAVILIEHDLDLVVSAADQVVVLHHGEVVCTAHPKRDPHGRETAVNAYLAGG